MLNKRKGYERRGKEGEWEGERKKGKKDGKEERVGEAE